MPDLKSEMHKVINSWSDEAPTKAETGHPITTNSTRATFEYVRDNPGVTRDAAVSALERRGVPRGSSTSLLSVMVTRGNIRKTVDGALFAAQPEYKPLPNPKPKAAPVVVAPVEAPKAPEPVQITAEWSAEAFINTLNVKQARALYDELRTIF